MAFKLNDIIVSVAFSFLFFLSSCGLKSTPENYKETTDSLCIYPDYKNVVVPFNIGPLNFMVQNECEEVYVKISCAEDSIELSARSGEVRFPAKEWKKILSENNDDSLRVNVWLRNKEWEHYPEFYIRVVPDSIDPYITFRMIEPSYMGTGNVYLSQYNMETLEQKKFVDSHFFRSDPSYGGSRCMNCHTAQASNPRNACFHHRGSGGGMVLTYKGETKVVATKVGDMANAAVYQRWHPTLPFIVFSNNTVKQLFPTENKNKIECFDMRSDILLYDIEKNTIRYVLKTHDDFETYPVWSASGDYIYYCVSGFSEIREVGDFTKKKYNLNRIKFNLDSMSFGKPELVFDAERIGKSVSKPRVSPDGRYIIMTISEFGAYHYTHKDAEVVLYDTKDSSITVLSDLNSKEAEGYVSWSSNGRWIMVGSRREDGNYVRLYFSYFDEDGKTHKVFQLPHESPSYDRMLLKCYNYPEFSKVDVDLEPRDIYSLLEKNTPIVPEYVGTIDEKVTLDGVAGASVIK